MTIKVEQSTISTPKLLKWNEIAIPKHWKIETTQPPRNIPQRKISQIIEQYDGRFLIRFNSFRYLEKSPIIFMPESLKTSTSTGLIS